VCDSACVLRVWVRCVLEEMEGDVLCGVGAVVHEEEIYFADIVDEEGFVAGGGKVACLSV
jgi:hypothetical protein